MFAQGCGGLVLLREPHEIARLLFFGRLAVGKIKGESFFLPQHAVPRALFELPGDEQGRFASVSAHRRRWSGIGLQFKLFTGTDVNLRDYRDGAFFGLD